MNVYRLDRRGNLDNLHLHDEDIPVPQRGEVLVRVRAVSLNYRDLAMAYRRFFADAPDGLIPVSDAAGEIAAVGRGGHALRGR
ncbi:alcohol dehydrogenase catalytic domain-containing protein [Promicromonospora sp. NPDC090134]|uniref:alcohol dehydrogenase catalytic domain-containing protein n=1 Tax=Promicromonospora sp. NPDC090134 TaxID=3364408 RepID=UPI0038241B03